MSTAAIILFGMATCGFALGGALGMIEQYIHETEYVEHIILKHRIARAVSVGIV